MFIRADTLETFLARELGRKEVAIGVDIGLVISNANWKWNGVADLGGIVDIFTSFSNTV